MTPRPGSGQARAVFLDRDGTMIEDVGYLDALDRVHYYPWTVDAIRLLNRAGFAVVVVTNQSGIARGFFRRSSRRRIASSTRAWRRAAPALTRITIVHTIRPGG